MNETRLDFFRSYTTAYYFLDSLWDDFQEKITPEEMDVFGAFLGAAFNIPDWDLEWESAITMFYKRPLSREALISASDGFKVLMCFAEIFQERFGYQASFLMSILHGMIENPKRYEKKWLSWESAIRQALSDMNLEPRHSREGRWDVRGNLGEDTPENREFILSATNFPENFRGRDKYGNDYYLKTHGTTQAWAKVRHGMIFAGGKIEYLHISQRTGKTPNFISNPDEAEIWEKIASRPSKVSEEEGIDYLHTNEEGFSFYITTGKDLSSKENLEEFLKKARNFPEKV